MRGEGQSGDAISLTAVGGAILWGLGLMLVGALIQGVYDYLRPLAPGTHTVMTYAWQGLGALVSGYIAGRRAEGAGWLHGGLAGVGLALSAAAVMGVLIDLPTMAALLRGTGAGGAIAALAGVAGVNFR